MDKFLRGGNIIYPGSITYQKYPGVIAEDVGQFEGTSTQVCDGKRREWGECLWEVPLNLGSPEGSTRLSKYSRGVISKWMDQ